MHPMTQFLLNYLCGHRPSNISHKIFQPRNKRGNDKKVGTHLSHLRTPTHQCAPSANRTGALYSVYRGRLTVSIYIVVNSQFKMVFRSDKLLIRPKNFARNLHFSLKQKDGLKMLHRRKSDGKCFMAFAFVFGFCSGGLLSVLELRWLPDVFTALKSKLVIKKIIWLDNLTSFIWFVAATEGWF
jgi:hypothetical protein